MSAKTLLVVLAACAAIILPTTGAEAVSAPSEAQHNAIGRSAGIAVYVYNSDQLVHQLNVCPEFGPEPQFGCDQCMPRSIIGNISQFCGPDHECHNAWLDPCHACNGACGGGLFASTWDRDHYLILHTPSAIDDAIEGCNQWPWKTYCVDSWGTPVVGAYRKPFEASIGWIPGSDYDSYYYLASDTRFWNVVDRLERTDHYYYNEERAWRERIGALAIVIEEMGGPAEPSRAASAAIPGTVEWYQRAFLLSLWLYVYDWNPGGLTPTDLGFPSDYPGPQEIRNQMIEIHEATCNSFFFDDCGLIGTEQESWGRVKAYYR